MTWDRTLVSQTIGKHSCTLSRMHYSVRWPLVMCCSPTTCSKHMGHSKDQKIRQTEEILIFSVLLTKHIIRFSQKKTFQDNHISNKLFYKNHHHVMLLVWISLTLSCNPSLSSITSGRSSRLHPMAIQSYCRKVLLGHPTLAHPCEQAHRRTLLMISFLPFQQCPTCLVHLIRWF